MFRVWDLLMSSNCSKPEIVGSIQKKKKQILKTFSFYRLASLKTVSQRGLVVSTVASGYNCINLVSSGESGSTVPSWLLGIFPWEVVPDVFVNDYSDWGYSDSFLLNETLLITTTNFQFISLNLIIVLWGSSPRLHSVANSVY